METGRNVTITLTLVQSNGSPADITAAGTKLYFTAKKGVWDDYGDSVLVKVWDADTPGNTLGIEAGLSVDQAIVEIEPEDTADWGAGLYPYDCLMIADAKRSTPVRGELIVSRSVSDPP